MISQQEAVYRLLARSCESWMMDEKQLRNLAHELVRRNVRRLTRAQLAYLAAKPDWRRTAKAELKRRWGHQ